MSNNEICITEFELANSEGNLRKLEENWTQVPIVPESTLSQSKGNSAKAVCASLQATTQISHSFQVLLDSTVDFFDKMGIAFHESDESAARNIDAITGH